MSKALASYLESQMTEAVHSLVQAMALALKERYSNVVAVLAYGSALRDSNPADTLVDFYVLTQTNADVSTNALARLGCKFASPNVYYFEHAQAGQKARAKYAIMPIAQLREKVSSKSANPYFWARFCQPCRLVWHVNENAKHQIVEILQQAAATAASEARALAPNAAPLEQWQALFQKTYGTELRPEDPARAQLIVNMQAEHFSKVSDLADVIGANPKSWATRRWQGKALSILRLIKASFTFQGGADYAAWKIKRHSGVDIAIKPWHRRHPLLASLVLLPQVLRKGGLK
jgi:hypothetical protein